MKIQIGMTGWGENEVWVGQKVADALDVKAEIIYLLASGHGQDEGQDDSDDPDGNLPDDLVLADLPTVQSLLSRPGELNRVEVVIDQIERRRIWYIWRK